MPTPIKPSLLAALLLGCATPFAHAQVTPCVADDLSAVPVRYNVDFTLDIQPIFSVACSGCHIGGTAGGLSLAEGSAHGNLVNVAANNPNAGMARITPANPLASFLFQKINCTNLNEIPDTPFGLRMPRSGPPYLSAQDQAAILDWIEQGATPASDPDRVFGSGFEGRVSAGK